MKIQANEITKIQSDALLSILAKNSISVRNVLILTSFKLRLTRHNFTLVFQAVYNDLTRFFSVLVCLRLHGVSFEINVPYK